MTQLQFDSRDGRYHGEWANGQRFSVDADVLAEAKRDRIQEMGFSPVDHIPESYADQADLAVLDSSSWSEDMDGVEVEA